MDTLSLGEVTAANDRVASKGEIIPKGTTGHIVAVEKLGGRPIAFQVEWPNGKMTSESPHGVIRQ